MKRLAPRWVGTALRKTPRGKSIPWHRVINSRGAISFPAGSPQAAEQRRLLEMEGVEFDGRGQVDCGASPGRGRTRPFCGGGDCFPRARWLSPRIVRSCFPPARSGAHQAHARLR